MRVLLVTGQLAKRVVDDSALQQSSVEFSVKALPTAVAALLTSRYIAKELKCDDLSGYDAVIIPGMVRGDTSVIEDVIGIPVFKGTRYASDIPIMLEILDRVKLSRSDPADHLLSEYLRKRNIALLEETERPEAKILRKPWNMVIGRDGTSSKIFVGRDFPMRVVAEILDAPLLSEGEILRKAAYYVESGAQIIDVGMLAGETRPEDAKRIVTLLRRKLKIPVSIDTFDHEEIEAALLSGADMVLSLNSQNMDRVNYPNGSPDVAVVVIPERGRETEQIASSKSVKDRVNSLEQNVRKAFEVGFNKIIADPIIDPIVFPGMVSSITVSRSFSEHYPDIPLIFGVGNITELIDADSPGVNAAIAGIAQELDASLLLTTEGSVKTKGAVKELMTACHMMYLAKRRKMPPKDLGVSLLRLKEKRSREVPYDIGTVARDRIVKISEAKMVQEPITDPKGFFKIGVDRDKNEVIVSHFVEKTEVPDLVVKGSDPLTIRDAIAKLDLISSLEHAYYLGVEVEKACIASRINRSYCQDEELFQTESID